MNKSLLYSFEEIAHSRKEKFLTQGFNILDDKNKMSSVI